MTRGFTPKQIKDIQERDKKKCVYCGWPSLEIDHVVPYIKGGLTIKANGVCVCRWCNRKKGGRLSMDFITRGLFYLSTVGENTDWVDKLKEDKATYTV